MKERNSIRGIIFSIAFHLDASKVRTWNEICEFYSKDIKELTNEEINDKMTVLLSDLENRFGKIELDKANLKYPFIVFVKSSNSLFLNRIEHLKNEVSNFECKITKEENFEERKFFLNYLIKVGVREALASALNSAGTVFSDVVLAGFDAAVNNAVIFAHISFPAMLLFAGIHIELKVKNLIQYYEQDMLNDLRKLDDCRFELNRKIRDCQGSMEEKKKCSKRRKTQ